MIPLDTSLAALPGIQRFTPKLKKIHIATVGDLLRYFPVRYEDFSVIRPIADLEPGEMVTVQGTIEESKARRTWQKHLAVVEAVVSDETGAIRATWFNQPYLRDTLRPGRLLNLSGKVSLSEKGELYLAHPAFEFISPTRHPTPETITTKHTARLVPVYGETKGLTSKGIRFLVEPLLSRANFEEWLPETARAARNFPAAPKAFRDIHFPAALEDAERARERFAFEELFLLQITNLKEKLTLAKTRSLALATNIEWLKGVLATLPFSLTESQKRSLWEIIQDLGKSHPMNRLLRGDVGSGKTAVAALAALVAAKNGVQSAFMAPTEILARQHFATVAKLFRGVAPEDQPAVGLLTSSGAEILYGSDLLGKTTKKELLLKIKNGEVSIVVGTHALLEKGVQFNKLALAIIDEQHRFGVRQRALLANSKWRIANRTDDSRLAISASPHYLSMSATPIPRTLMLTIFGDLDVSLITELPSGRKNIVTKVVPPEDRAKIYAVIREKVKEGRQVFVICPRIERKEEAETGRALTPLEAAMLDAKSVEEEYEKLSKTVFPDLRIAKLHGKMKPAEKEKVMKEFQGGGADILVATSVVEVGVDVQNAVIMMIESSDRFGLAQLYQFRGRVGRGEHQSYCFLMTSSDAKTANARLKALVNAKNGFELAEYDLKIRGPGQFMGDAQTGLPDIAMQSLAKPELVKDSRAAAGAVLQKDPALQQYPLLRKKLEQFGARVHPE